MEKMTFETHFRHMQKVARTYEAEYGGICEHSQRKDDRHEPVGRIGEMDEEAHGQPYGGRGSMREGLSRNLRHGKVWGRMLDREW